MYIVYTCIWARAINNGDPPGRWGKISVAPSGGVKLQVGERGGRGGVCCDAVAGLPTCSPHQVGGWENLKIPINTMLLSTGSSGGKFRADPESRAIGRERERQGSSVFGSTQLWCSRGTAYIFPPTGSEGRFSYKTVFLIYAIRPSENWVGTDWQCYEN